MLPILVHMGIWAPWMGPMCPGVGREERPVGNAKQGRPVGNARAYQSETMGSVIGNMLVYRDLYGFLLNYMNYY